MKLLVLYNIINLGQQFFCASFQSCPFDIKKNLNCERNSLKNKPLPCNQSEKSAVQKTTLKQPLKIHEEITGKCQIKPKLNSNTNLARIR